jgi:uncharacterized protein YjbI with pentapeptide repeats
MSDQIHVNLLKEGVSKWNRWRNEHPGARIDLSDADFSGKDLRGANLDSANLSDAVLKNADLEGATLVEARCPRVNMSGACLKGATASKAHFGNADFVKSDSNGAVFSGAFLMDAHFNYAKCRGADFTAAELWGADLSGCDLTAANLDSALLEQCRMVKTNLDDANLTSCRVYGASVWGVSTKGTQQINLIVSAKEEPTITVDNLEVAQFIYLLLNNEKVRNVIDTITSKVVLILGRFTPERKAILDVIRDELRKRDYLPVLFDFEKPSSRDVTETVSTLAHMAKFVIADITDAKSIPQELMAIVPSLPSVPVQPLLLASQQEYGMFEHFKRYPWVLEPFLYDDQDRLLAALNEKVIGPAEQRAKEQTGR